MASIQSGSPSPSTSVFPEGSKMAQPPPLPINLRRKIRSIIVIWSSIVFFTCLLDEVLYFALRYGAKTSTHVALTVPTAILGAFSVFTIGWRTFCLLRKGSDCRPVGGSWWSLDYFGWNVIIGFIVVTATLVTASGQHPPNVRLASLPQAIVLYLAGSQLFLTAVANSLGWKTPVRLSSTPAGSVVPPGVFILIEDVVAVDGGGRQEFRKHLAARYAASPWFRKMLSQLNWSWAIGSLAVAAGQTVISYVLNDLNVVFALGWSLSWVSAAIGTVCTIKWAGHSLPQERSQWAEPGS